MCTPAAHPHPRVILLANLTSLLSFASARPPLLHIHTCTIGAIPRSLIMCWTCSTITRAPCACTWTPAFSRRCMRREIAIAMSCGHLPPPPSCPRSSEHMHSRTCCSSCLLERVRRHAHAPRAPHCGGGTWEVRSGRTASCSRGRSISTIKRRPVTTYVVVLVELGTFKLNALCDARSQLCGELRGSTVGCIVSCSMTVCVIHLTFALRARMSTAR